MNRKQRRALLFAGKNAGRRRLYLRGVLDGRIQTLQSLKQRIEQGERAPKA